jgi:hypothetical protein
VEHGALRNGSEGGRPRTPVGSGNLRGADAGAPADPAIGPKASPVVCVPAHIDPTAALPGWPPDEPARCHRIQRGHFAGGPGWVLHSAAMAAGFLATVFCCQCVLQDLYEWRVRDVRVMSSQSG